MITSNTERKRKGRNSIETELGKAPIRLAKGKTKANLTKKKTELSETIDLDKRR